MTGEESGDVSTEGGGSSGGVSRRTVVGGGAAAGVTAAAWGVPVVAAMIASPAASASPVGPSITLDFVAVLLLLRHSDTLSVLIAITNNGSEAVGDSAVVTLSGIPDDAVDIGFDTAATQYSAPAGSNTTDRAVQNSLFTFAPMTGGGYALTSAGALDLAAGQTVYLFFTLSWKTDNDSRGVFVIAGSLTFGGRGVAAGSDGVSVQYDEG